MHAWLTGSSMRRSAGLLAQLARASQQSATQQGAFSFASLASASEAAQALGTTGGRRGIAYWLQRAKLGGGGCLSSVSLVIVSLLGHRARLSVSRISMACKMTRLYRVPQGHQNAVSLQSLRRGFCSGPPKSGGVLLCPVSYVPWWPLAQYRM